MGFGGAYGLDDLERILLHPGDFKQTIEITHYLCISHSKTELINIINQKEGDISQKDIALWVCNKLYPKEDEITYRDPYEDENEDKENVHPNVGINLQKTPKYTLVDLNTLFDRERQTVLRKFSDDIEEKIDVFIKQVLKETELVLRDYINKIIQISMDYIQNYPRFKLFIEKLFYDRLVNWMDRLTDMKKNCKIKDCNKIIDYWYYLLSNFILVNLSKYKNLAIDEHTPQTSYAIMGGRRRKIKKTKKKSLRKRKQSRKK